MMFYRGCQPAFPGRGGLPDLNGPGISGLTCERGNPHIGHIALQVLQCFPAPKEVPGL